ncbi:hypothetical protein BGX28_005075 [Mortierella sp. GBA30]|nr:hypothetical protein BGX28_005075 [Mortierella sp. GBA30]
MHYNVKPLGLSLILLSICILLFCSAPAHAQETANPSPEPSPPAEITPTATTDPVIPTEAPSVSVSVSIPALPTTQPTAAPVPNVPEPVFPATTETCVECKPDFPLIRNCSSRLPTTGNLTVIHQVLPFYACMCVNSGAAFDSLQKCSQCFRSTGQQSYLNPAFYNVTNMMVSSLKQVCNDTANGSTVPSGAGSSRWDILASALVWGALSTLAVVLLPLGGL